MRIFIFSFHYELIKLKLMNTTEKAGLFKQVRKGCLFSRTAAICPQKNRDFFNDTELFAYICTSKNDMENKSDNLVYSPAVIEFVTVAVEFCAFLESENLPSREEWLGKMLKILPLMYIKAALLPQTVATDDEPPATFVKEEDYVRVAAAVAAVMGEEDVYLDVFVEDMKYSERPVSAFVSENVADIYQDVRNFVSVYQFGLTEQMNDALAALIENFVQYWGQKLINVLRPLHALRYADDAEQPFDDEFNTDELWD